MKLGFVHDHTFICRDGQCYSYGRLPSEAWSRYLKHFEKLKVVGRQLSSSRGELTRGLVLSDAKGVEFSLISTVERGVKGYLAILARSDDLANRLGDCDAVVARVPSVLGILAARMCLSTGKPLALEVVGSARLSYQHHRSIFSKFVAPLMERLTAKVVASAPYVLYVTEEFLQAAYPTSGVSLSASNVVLPTCSVELKKRRRELATRRANTFLRIGLIGSVSSRHKGLAVALEALQILKESGRTFDVEVIVESGFDETLAAIAACGLQRSASVSPRLPGPDAVVDWLCGIDIYVHPSFAEGLPRTLIEAMAAGCACVATDVGGTRELLSAEFLSPPGDSLALARRLDRLVSSATARARQEEANLLIVQRFEPETLSFRRDQFFGQFREYVEKELVVN